MVQGVRVTDVVGYLAQRGETRGAVRIVCRREPERFRWRRAMAGVSELTASLRGLDRLRVEEPVRELVLDLSDVPLRREVVLDARAHGVDLDRGEILRSLSLYGLWGLAVEQGVDPRTIGRYARLPSDAGAPIDTAACAIVSRRLAEHHRTKAHRLWLSVPDADDPGPQMLHHRVIRERAQRERAEAERWAKLARLLLEEA